MPKEVKQGDLVIGLMLITLSRVYPTEGLSWPGTKPIMYGILFVEDINACFLVRNRSHGNSRALVI